jgi:hypothetical protein
VRFRAPLSYESSDKPSDAVSQEQRVILLAQFPYPSVARPPLQAIRKPMLLFDLDRHRGPPTVASVISV